jgi:nucleoside-diphosphate-sugar epimerase
MRAFVTGASGKIGRRLVRALHERGDDVVGLTRTPAGEQVISSAGGRALRGSLADARALEEGVAEADEVYHLAGGVRGRGAESADVLNGEGTERLARAIAARHASPVVVLTSTGAVYGDRSGLWVDETMPPFPGTAYADSKLRAERALADLDARVARLAVVYGPRFPILRLDAMHRGRAWLPGEGWNHLPLVHVDDAVEALVTLARTERARGITNVADRDPRPIRDLFDAIRRRVGGPGVRFWSTWVPSGVQLALAAENEAMQSRLGLLPVATPDNLRLYAASLRLKVDRLAELNFRWRYATLEEGVTAALGGEAR